MGYLLTPHSSENYSIIELVSFIGWNGRSGTVYSRLHSFFGAMSCQHRYWFSIHWIVWNWCTCISHCIWQCPTSIYCYRNRTNYLPWVRKWYYPACSLPKACWRFSFYHMGNRHSIWKLFRYYEHNRRTGFLWQNTSRIRDGNSNSQLALDTNMHVCFVDSLHNSLMYLYTK